MTVQDMRWPTLELKPDELGHEFKFGKQAGHNKFNMYFCPMCASRGHAIVRRSIGTRMIFGFVDELSAREYEISGLCQSCQNITFVEDPDDAA